MHLYYELYEIMKPNHPLEDNSAWQYITLNKISSGKKNKK